ncbi:uncharacterized protein LOC121395491 [Xenopus laevis]|uniref:Gypsy retrotransposon integrase-like protein 1 n=1 Tax=Xenopus laevis TaxID=8355 RepID=A0A8J1L8Q6_XENLA|nr:uncharacterized protein LOC121395491 [Xenopus laevis]
MASYKRQSKEQLSRLCEERGIAVANQTKEWLIASLVESDQESSTGQVGQTMDIAIGQYHSDESGSNSSQSGTGSSLQLVLQQLGSSDPNLRLQLILQYQQAEAAAAERQAAAEREAAAAAEREAAERQAEREAAERQAERQFQLEMARLQKGTAPPHSSDSREANVFKPRLENFPVMEKDGDLDTFLRGFEKTCRQFHLPREQWASFLTPGLKGKALEVFADLPPEYDGDYDEIKKALIRHFNLTPEVHRKKFRSLQRGAHDSYTDVVGRLRITFHQWVQGRSVSTFTELEDLMILDQFLCICPVEVQQFVVDREPKTADQAAQIADAYTANRMPAARKPIPNPGSHSWKGGKSGGSPSFPSYKPGGSAAAPAGSPGVRPGQVDARRCFICNKVGHLSHVCPDKRKPTPPGKPPGPSTSVLFVAGMEGSHKDNLQPVTVGTQVTVGLRDTGAEVTLVRPELVNCEDIIPGKTMAVTGFGGVHPAVPMARVYLDWGAGRGLREVGVSETIPTNVLLGTDLGRLVSQYVPAGDPLEPAEPYVNPAHLQVSDNDVDCDGGWEGNQDVFACNSVLEPAESPCIDLGGGEVYVPSLSRGENNFTGSVGGFPVASHCDVGGGNLPCVAAVTRQQSVRASQYQTGGTGLEGLSLSGEEGPSEGSPLPVALLCPDPEDRGVPASGALLTLTPDPRFEASSREFEAALLTDASLEKMRGLAAQPPAETDKERIYWHENRLYRESMPTTTPEKWVSDRQLVVPLQFREQLLRIAHEIPLAGHLGVQKTKARLVHNFYWPNMGTDIANYCRSCHTCQRVGKNGDMGRAPLVPLPVIDEPFQRVAVDLIGPLAIPSSSGKRFILTVVDYATRYPEAVALSSIRADKVADALLSIFSRVGFPKEILTDQGTQFMSNLMQCLCKKIQVNHLIASPYHPQTNGLCERFNGTLKHMLKTFVESQGKDWERYLPHLLFAYREVPQASTGFSPFELLYGRRVRGPLDLVREAWEGKLDTPEVSVVEYVIKFREKMEALTGLAHNNVTQAQAYQKQWYDRHARERVYEAGQKVWVLVPMRQNKLQAAWEGPYTILERANDVNYVIALDEDGKRKKVYHVNMIKAHYEREVSVMPVCGMAEESGSDPLLDLVAMAQGTEGIGGSQVSSMLTVNQRTQVMGLLNSYVSTFSGKPGRTSLAIHHVDTGDNRPIRQMAYRVSLEVKENLQREIEEMIGLGVIVPSHSPWASPVVLVPKKDGTTRFCVDYRKLNLVTTFDAYPMPRIDELLDQLAGAQYITIMDLSRGYWQIPMSPEAQERSAFITPFGLYEFQTMPFGMKNAPATFQRLVNQLLGGLEGFAVAYLDDIAIFSNSWEEHLAHLSQVLDRIQGAGLTIKPEKCQIGMTEVQYLGHRVGSGTLRPEPGKVEAITNWPTPKTKKQVMSFLGTAGYYRKFVPNYSALAKPLTDLTKKKLARLVEWTADCDQAFKTLKTSLASAPVLQAPDFTRRFVVQTDASNYGLGAVLSQVNSKGEEHPVIYLSRKLLPREVAYATVEKECLAVVWALQKLQPYLYGRNFTVITDHNPLSWLNKVAGDNGKLLRWSLILQQYDFTIQHKKGSEHGNADGLSRQGDCAELVGTGEGR